MTDAVLFVEGEKADDGHRLTKEEAARENTRLKALEGNKPSQFDVVAHEVAVREAYNRELEIQLAHGARASRSEYFEALPVPSDWEQIEAEMETDLGEWIGNRCSVSIHASPALRRAR